MVTEIFLSDWLETFVRPFRAENTYKCYRRAIASLPPYVAAVPLDQLTGLHIQRAVNEQAVAHPRAAQLTFATLHAAFSHAVRLGLLTVSPMLACVKPVHVAAKAPTLTLLQLAMYIQAAQSNPCGLLLMAMAVCGLRRGEALGLQWRDVDLSLGVLHVRRQRIRSSAGYLVSQLKTATSARDIVIPAAFAQLLAAARQQRSVIPISGWLIDTTPERLAKQHDRVLLAAGLPHVTLHGLRHSMATGAVESGCPIKVLQGILGHSKYQLTADLYANHLSAAVQTPYMAQYAAHIF